MLKNLIDKLILQLPYVGKWRRVFLLHSTPGHYYSPIPDKDDILKREKTIFDFKNPIKEIDLNIYKQQILLENYKSNSSLFNKALNESFQLYNEDNIYFSYHDAVALHLIINEFNPKNIIEIGSGFSSCLMIDFNTHFYSNSKNLTFIEPYPDERLKPLTANNSNISFKLEQNYIQNIHPDFFLSLKKNDILFIDSSHVSKVGSDLNYILFEILPILEKGVIIHFHDIHFPFEYPKEWIYKGYAWNESYILRAFLMYNTSFEILYMNSLMALNYEDLYNDCISPPYPYILSKSGGIYIRKK